MEKIKIFIDVDGVVLETTQAMAQWYEHRYGIKVNHLDIYYYDCRVVMPLLKYEDIIELFESDFFFKNVRAKPAAHRVVHELYRSGDFDVFFCSIGTKVNIEKKTSWLLNNFPFIEQDHHIMIEKEGGHTGKGNYLPSDGNYIIVDDHQNNLMTCNARHKVLYADEGIKEYNKDFKGIVVNNMHSLEKNLTQLIKNLKSEVYI